MTDRQTNSQVTKSYRLGGGLLSATLKPQQGDCLPKVEVDSLPGNVEKLKGKKGMKKSVFLFKYTIFSHFR